MKVRNNLIKGVKICNDFLVGFEDLILVRIGITFKIETNKKVKILANYIF